MKIKIGNREIKTVVASLLIAMDTGADSFACVTEWTAGIDPAFDEIVKPRSFAEAEVSIKGEKLLTGHKYISAPNLSGKGQLTLEGFSKTYQLIRSNPKVKKEYGNSSLLDIAVDQCEPFGIPVGLQNVNSADLADAETGIKQLFTSGPTIGEQQKIFDFIQNLARERGVLVSNTADGNLIFLRANVKQTPVGSIIEGPDGSIPVTGNFSARFDDTTAMKTYSAWADAQFSFEEKGPKGIATDDRISIPGFKSVVFNALVEGDGQKQVEFTRNQILAQSMSMPFQANSWEAPNGELWRDNTFVSVESPTLFVPNGFTFLIRAVQYNLDSQGETAILSLVPPSLYTGEDVEEPWG